MESNGSSATTMCGARLPGDSTVELSQVPVPERGPGQVLVRMRASTICGTDLRAIYHGHVGPEPYDGVIAGHEPCGEVVEADAGSRLRPGDRVVIYHIVGCLRCRACRAGSYITCEARFPDKVAYGYQRDGGHAEYLLAEEQSCVPLPDELSFVDGAAVACGFGTAYEGIVRGEIDGRDAVLVTGLGPVGLAAGLLAKAMGARHVIGFNRSPARSALALQLGAVDEVVTPGAEPDDLVEQVMDLTNGRGVEVAVDCTGANQARAAALRATRSQGRLVLVGEGGRMGLDASEWVIHPQRRIIGSWVTSVPRMEDLLEHLVRWQLHPERTVTGCFPLEGAADAYALADSSSAGKVAIVMPE
jgi:threonine dehydrogenase-like Zn-dependent dehydrogenase